MPCSCAVCAGVEYAVVRASFQQQLQQTLLAAVGLWLPLLPLLIFAQRLVDSRSGTRRAKNNNAKTPKVTFADVAGEQGPAGVTLPWQRCAVGRHMHRQSLAAQHLDCKDSMAPHSIAVMQPDNQPP